MKDANLLAKDNKAYKTKVKKLFNLLEKTNLDQTVDYISGWYPMDNQPVFPMINHDQHKGGICLCNTSWSEWKECVVWELLDKLENDEYIIENVIIKDLKICEDFSDVIFIDILKEEWDLT